MTLVVVLGVVVWGGGENFYTWALGNPMYDFRQILDLIPFLLF